MAYTLLTGGCYDSSTGKYVDAKNCAADCAASPSNPACKPAGPGAADYIGAIGNLFGTMFGPKPAPPPVAAPSGPSMTTIAILAGGAFLAIYLLRG